MPTIAPPLKGKIGYCTNFLRLWALRESLSGEKRRYRLRTPAMALGLTDHIGTVGEILRKPLVVGLAA